MPNSANPQLVEWLPTLQDVIGEPDDELVLIGHSLGCVTIMRYLEQLKEGVQIAGVIFVAGFTEDLGFDELKNFFTTPIDFEKVKNSAKHFYAIASDDDPYVPLKYADILKEKFGAEVTRMNNMKHFSGAADGESPCLNLPIIIELLQGLSL